MQRKEKKNKIVRWLLLIFCAIIILVFIEFAAMQSSYLNWDYNNPDLAVAGTILHGVEFLFVRIAPLIFIVSVVGIILTYKKINSSL